MVGSVYTLIPPLIVILMVIATKKILLSISSGIVASALLLNQLQPTDTAKDIVSTAVGIFYDGKTVNTDNILLILFILGLGIITAFIEKNGGTVGFARWAQKHVKNAAMAQMVAVVLGILIFIDDYFTALTVGEGSRSLTDKYKVSREKLAYLIDSTSAPVCSICPLSSWGAYIIALYAVLLPPTAAPLNQFISTIPYNFYAIFALGVVIFSAGFNINVGKMNDVASIYRKAAQSRKDEGMVQKEGEEKASDLVVPILLLAFVSMAMMYVTGFVKAESFNIFQILENASTYLALFIGCLTALAYCGVRYYRLHGHHPLKVAKEGVRAVAGATMALLFAWVLIDMISAMETGTFLSGLIVKYAVPAVMLPFLLFVLSSVMALATGFSWGVFGIMLPISVQMTQALGMQDQMVFCCLGAVLSGSVFGDHCSPISDTTILSSAGAQCNHVDHVVSQMPYALYSGMIAALGFLVIGFTENLYLALGIQVVLLIVTILLFRISGSGNRVKRVKNRRVAASM